MLTDDEYYEGAVYYSGAMAVSKRPIDYIEPTPNPFVVQIPLVEYFERITKLKTDRWQKHFLNYLQAAVENMHIKPSWDEFHAEPQLGKTRGLSQVFPSWCFGHMPLFRYTLAMYNISRSSAHADVIIQIMRSPLYRDIFPHNDSHLPKHASKEGFMTNARRDVEGGRMDAQKSLNPVGLESGMTGSGTDWLTIDDPYKEPKDAFSENMWINLDRFWKYGVSPRLLPHTCVAAMFHRYSYDDFGGYLLNTGKFNYVRYATVADGPYIHDETGQKFEDPLGREIGEYVCPERRPESYYREKRADDKVWLSMFQGRPGREEGDFFQVDKIEVIQDQVQGAAEWSQCFLRGRGWDHAATQGSGDQSAGAKMGLQPNGTAIVPDVFSAQLSTDNRVAKQREIAEDDGTDVTVVVPEGVSSDGKDVVFMMRQNLQGFNVVARKVTNASPGFDAKKRRAYNLSIAVNSSKVKFIFGPWVERVKRLMRRFGNSTSGDDEIDALSDVYNFLYEELHKGLVFKNYHPGRNLIPKPTFMAAFPYKPTTQNGNGSNGHHEPPQLKIPAEFTIYAALKINAEQSRPTSGIIAARASEMSGIGESIVVFSEYKAYDGDVYKIIQWLQAELEIYCGDDSYKDRATIWLHPDSDQFETVIAQKLKTPVATFDGDSKDGITEMDWHLLPTGEDHPFNSGEKAARTYFLVDEDQLSIPTNTQGFIHARQEFATWGFNDKGEPSAVGGVLDCLRMITAKFATYSRPLTQDQKFTQALQDMMPEPLKGKTAMEIAQMPTVSGQMAPMLTLQMNEALLKERRRKEKQYIPNEEEEDSMANGW